MRSILSDRLSALALIALTLMVLPMPLQAQEMAPACTVTAVPEGVFAPWSTPTDIVAGRDPKRLAAATIRLGQAARIALLPTPEVHYAVQPEKPGGSVSHGGLVGFAVAEGGNYRIALGSPAWIDVIGRDNTGKDRAATSTAHGHGPACTGIRKIVDFTLAKGSYTLQLSANAEPQTTVLITGSN